MALLYIILKQTKILRSLSY